VTAKDTAPQIVDAHHHVWDLSVRDQDWITGPEPVVMPASAATLGPRRRLRYHPLEQLPQLIRHQPLNDPHHDRQPAQPPE
jgi:predicted TIM-barrel fold metal-dependent hydrolase